MRKIQKFTAGNPAITSTYAGEAASDYIAAALLSARTLDNQLITIKPNVKFKEVIQKLDVDGIVQDASCDFVTSGSVAISERVLTPKELQVNLSLCKQEFVDSWEALSLGYSAFDEIPRNFNDYLVSYVGGKVAEATETAIWQGTATNGSFPGFENAFSASAATLVTSAVQPARTGGDGAIISGSITSANVVDKLTAVYDTISSEVFGKEDLVIYGGTNVIKAYQSALSGQTNIGSFNNQLNVGEKPSNFQGIEIVLAPGMSANAIVAAQKSNLFFGTGLLSDYNEVRVLDMADLDGSQNYRVIMRYTAGTQFGVASDIVYYGAF
jgi:hypothetical protein|tara:strand:+ start:737 stop:1711 length:975 start_codon:yes stop_codon:yes gene_type:complete